MHTLAGVPSVCYECELFLLLLHTCAFMKARTRCISQKGHLYMTGHKWLFMCHLEGAWRKIYPDITSSCSRVARQLREAHWVSEMMRDNMVVRS